MTAGTARVEILADHSVLLAIPAFLPAIALVAIIVVIAVRDRRSEARENGAPNGAGSGDTVGGDDAMTGRESGRAGEEK
ncbi:MAG TPA: hypothetical protein VK083_09375 [Nocardia sp.]|uniref:hypothetical protein n=1 Tax=Nocardia farcinica TaxID=37329 RepID=UPI00245756A3|nr:MULTISPECIES: hypothetical protein [Nocardia]HLS76985.1 hypothetical protein [Nocardia sp.]